MNGIESPRRVAAIDVGTNSIHMIIVELEARGYRVIDREKEMVQLGRGSLAGGPLTPDAVSRAISAMQKISEIARQRNVDQILAVATSAVREAANREEFIKAVEAASGVKVRIISGEEEAGYIFNAVRKAVDFGDQTGFCIDIGGGSVELIVGNEAQIHFARSEPLGSLRLTQMFFGNGTPQKGDVKRCISHVDAHLKKALNRIRRIGFDFCIGTSGTIMTLAEMASSIDSDSPPAFLRWLTSESVRALRESLMEISPADQVTRYGLDLRRAETLLAGAIVFERVLELGQIARLRSCSAAIREGLVEEALAQPDADDVSRTDLRTEAVMQLAERSGCDIEHARHVARLALRIFDQTGELHGLSSRERQFLEFAALLHEVGLQVAFEGHHRHTFYIVRHASLRGFTTDEVTLVANIARYYRKSVPDVGHPNFAELTPGEQGIVEKLSAILRIAEGLDRAHRQAVEDVTVSHDGRRTTLGLLASISPDVEIESARKRAKYFGKLFEREVEIVVARSGTGRSS